MIAIDTNVIVRALAGDDPAQSAKARALVSNERIHITTTVLLETEWVLRSSYRLPALRIIELLAAFVSHANASLQHPDQVATALVWAAKGMDFADALHLAGSEGCAGFASFDRKLVRTARAMGAIPVRAP